MDPLLKRKIKIFLQTVPFVPTPAAFFSAAGGVVIRRTFSAGAGRRGVGIHGTVFYRLYCYRQHSLPGSLFYTGCYSEHNSGEAALESPAQFAAGGVVISSTISVWCAARGKKFRLLSGAQFRLFFCGRQVVIHSTICAVWKIDYCYRQHNSPERDFSFPPFSLLLFCAHFTVCRISAELLSAAQFVKKNAFTPFYCCYTRHNFKNLFSGVVICGTF